VLEQLADYFSVLTGKTFEASAVKAQIAWGCTDQKEVMQAQAYNWVLNKAAAMETGFLEYSGIPPKVLIED
jgi:hypothetical protein